MDLFSIFLWAESSLLGEIGKNYGGVYATLGQSLHLTALAILGGSVLVTDLRLLGVIMRDVSSEVVADQAHRWFKIGLGLILVTGVFMAAAIAQRMYYSQFFWAKMIALATGILFVFIIKRPLLKGSHDQIQPWVIKLTAAASLMIWFTVAATGRWIGFSG